MSEKKLIRIFQRRLNHDQLEYRINSTKEVIKELVKNEQWSSWITGVILFGSTARGDSKTGSDVDLAILTKQVNYFGMDFRFITGNLMSDISQIQNQLGKSNFKINPTIVPEPWLENPQESRISNPQVMENIKREGVRIL